MVETGIRHVASGKIRETINGKHSIQFSYMCLLMESDVTHIKDGNNVNLVFINTGDFINGLQGTRTAK